MKMLMRERQENVTSHVTPQNKIPSSGRNLQRICISDMLGTCAVVSF